MFNQIDRPILQYAQMVTRFMYKMLSEAPSCHQLGSSYRLLLYHCRDVHFGLLTADNELSRRCT